MDSGVCIQCGKTALLGNSKYCPICREKNSTYKKTLTEQPISAYKENNSNCRLCDGPIDTLGIVCQKCLDQVQFTKQDAMVRYNEQCIKCSETSSEKLVFSSADISVPMKHTGPDLYRFICFSSVVPKDYILVCSSCYWQTNFDYIKHLRSVLLDDAADNEDIIVDTIETDEVEETDELD